MLRRNMSKHVAFCGATGYTLAMNAPLNDLVKAWAEARRGYLDVGGDVDSVTWTPEVDAAFDRFTDAELALAKWAKKEMDV